MKPTYHCIPCHVNHIYRVIAGLSCNESVKLSLLREMLACIAKEYNTPPDCAHDMYRIIKEQTGINDTFEEVKRQSNERMIRLLPQLKEVLAKGDALRKALQIALVANIIDYGIGNDAYHDEYADTFVALTEDCEIPDEFYTRFVQSMNSSQSILYIADNAGEIVADTLLAEFLPKGKLVFAVRGGAVINDATLDDVKEIGLDTIVPVITTGDSTPGINLKRSSKEFLHALQKADMVILKGQGNFETMIDAPLKNVMKKGARLFFLFKVKCIPVAEFTNKNVGDSAFIVREI